mgnify:FL=1
MVIGIVLIITALIIISIAVKRHIVKGHSTVSFAEAMDLVELPIITVQNNNTKINLLLDTGSNASYISPNILKDLKYDEIELSNTTIGFGGGATHTRGCNMEIKYKKLSFEDTFIIMESDEVFTALKQGYGVQVHGILGSKFFDRYSYVIDFGELIAYIK